MRPTGENKENRKKVNMRMIVNTILKREKEGCPIMK
jgi:hypothetical protein